jgi:hypothetical protein
MVAKAVLMDGFGLDDSVALRVDSYQVGLYWVGLYWVGLYWVDLYWGVWMGG